jgi:Ca2+-binding RTX toxin-like protein
MGNYIGLAADGITNRGNRQNGVLIQNGARDNIIGTDGDGVDDPTEGNTIAFNSVAGVMVLHDASTGNSIRGNSIHSNDDLGIDLGPAGVTPNDENDIDAGPNQLLNFPVLRAVRANTQQAPTTRVVGEYDGAPNTTLTLDFYANGEADTSGYGEGRRYLDSIAITTNNQGHDSFNVELQGETAAGELVTATATDASGNTSEFCGAFIATGKGSLITGGGPGEDTIELFPDPDGNPDTVTVIVNDVNLGSFLVEGEIFAWGLAGDDQIVLDPAILLDSNLDGGKGNDMVQGGGGDDEIAGGEGDDDLNGGAGDDALDGGAGNDDVDGGQGSDTIETGDGNDTVTTDADDDLGKYSIALVGPISITEGTDAVRGQNVTINAGFPTAGSTVGWNFGDGTTGAGARVSHVYTSESSYRFDATITDPSGQTTTIMRDLDIGIVALEADPTDASKTVLAVGGTIDSDTMVFNPGGSIQVLINGQSYGAFEPTGRIVAFGQAGDDDIQVAGSIALSAWLYGEAGDDRLKGGAGNDCLLGGIGYDHLLGGQGGDLLIGGCEADRLVGNAGDDILIGAATIYDSNPDGLANDAALMAILTEWNSSGDHAAIRDAWLQPGTQVLNDGVSDRITGSSGLDWFFADLGGQNDDDDEITDDEQNEVIDLLFSP